jgi:hypothetical protein
MAKDARPDFVPRALGSALVTGAALASIALSVGRPVVREGIHAACDTSSSAHKSARRAIREVGKAALESSQPLVDKVLDTKDRVVRRTVGRLPPGLGAAAEAWRLDFIVAEQAAYYGGRVALSDLEPRVDRACAVGLDLVDSVLDAVDGVVDAGVAAAATVGAHLQEHGSRRSPNGGRRRKPAASRR